MTDAEAACALDEILQRHVGFDLMKHLLPHKRERELEQFRRCRSPMEERFLVFAWTEINYGSFADIAVNHRIGKYTADFVIWVPQNVMEYEKCQGVNLIVEIDGREFHTAETQVAHDKKRDRELQCQGWNVMRFTGSEVWSKPDLCVAQVMDFLDSRGLTF